MQKNNISYLSPRDSKTTALQNILNKVQILEDWLRNGIPWQHSHLQERRDDKGNRLLVYFPQSLRSFNHWNGSQYSNECCDHIENIKSISGNGTDTLNKYPAIKDRVVDLLIKLTHLALAQKALEAPNRVLDLEIETTRLKLFIENQTKKMVEIQRENIVLSRDLSAIERREKGSIEELSKHYSALESQNIKLREEISLLTKQLKNIHSLKSVKREN